MTAPARERVLLIGGPWADSVLWADDLAANQRAARRHRPDHPARDLAQYTATGEIDPGLIDRGQVVRPPGAAIWAYAEGGQRPGPPVGREPDLTKSAGDVARAQT